MGMSVSIYSILESISTTLPIKQLYDKHILNNYLKY